MNLSNINRALENIDYQWSQPKTYLVFVPGLTLLIQKIQLSIILPVINTTSIPQNFLQHNQHVKNFLKICKFHLLSATSHLAISCIAIKLFAHPIFIALGVVAALEMGSILSISFKNIVELYTRDANGGLVIDRKIPLSEIIFGHR